MTSSSRLFPVAFLFTALLVQAPAAHAQADGSKAFEEAAADMLSKLGSSSSKSSEYESVFSDEEDKAEEDPKSAERGKGDTDKPKKNPESVSEPSDPADNVPTGRSIANAPDTRSAPAQQPTAGNSAASGKSAAGAGASQAQGDGTATTGAASNTGFGAVPKASATPGFAAVERPQPRKDVAATTAPKTR